jgi:hypothetical protein
VDWRVRQQIAGMPAVAARLWLEQVPVIGDADIDRYARELAAAMDERQRRLGEHAAEHRPAWSRALGPVPEHPLDRAEWEHRAGQVAAYREMWGFTHPYEPIGPRPGQHSPEARASWQAAAEALGYQPGSLREHSDGQLWAWRSAFAREMAWAPPYQGDDLAATRREIRRTQIEADRARRNAEAATTDGARQRLADRAAVLARWEEMTCDLAARLAEAQEAYDAWERATAPTRDRAVAADAELRRRHPDRYLEPLRAVPASPEPESAEPEPEPAKLAEPEPEPAARTAGPQVIEPESVESESVPAARSAELQVPEPDLVGWPDLGANVGRLGHVAAQLREISARLDEAAMLKARQAQQQAAEIMSMQVPALDPDASPVAAWKAELEARQREAVRHEPMLRVPHAQAVATMAAEPSTRVADREAAE